MSTSTVATLFTSYTANVGTALGDNLPLALAIGAAVFGLIVVVRLGKRFIGGR